MGNFVFRIIRRIFRSLCRLLPVDTKKIAVVNFYGRGYGDNPKYVVEEILEQGLDFKIVWMVSSFDGNNLPSAVRQVKIGSLRYVYEMSTAKLRIENSRSYFPDKKKNQYCMQTWHGGFGLKKIEKDAQERLEKEYLIIAKRDGERTDVMLSNSKTLTKLYYDAFWFSGEVIQQGLPRNDKLFSYTDGDIKRIKSALDIPENKKIALYAPTFRQSHSLEPYNMDYKRLANALGEKFGGEWIVLLRLHPNVLELSDNIGADGETVFNASCYNDIQELYIISDVALTDYSSIMFDFMLLERPCFLYASDVEEYKKERDFFISIDSLPFPLASDNDELCENILNFEREEYNNRVRAFYDYHGFCDGGTASKAAVEWIKNKM